MLSAHVIADLLVVSFQAFRKSSFVSVCGRRTLRRFAYLVSIVYFSIVTKLRDINSICCKISNPHSYITPNPPNSNSQNINNSSPPTPSNSSHSKVPTATQPVESSPSKPADPQPHSTIHTDYTSSPSPSEVVVFAAYPTALHAVGGKRVGTPGRGLGIARARLCRRRLRRGCRGGIG